MRHTLSVLVENKPGVLTRVSGLFARRAFNIKSLTVGETEHPDISRMTIIVDADTAPIEAVERRMLLMKVRADDTCRTSVLQIVDLFRAHVVDVHPEAVVIESIGSLPKLEALLRALEPYGVTELVQSGAVAIGRGDHSITDQLKEN